MSNNIVVINAFHPAEVVGGSERISAKFAELIASQGFPVVYVCTSRQVPWFQLCQKLTLSGYSLYRFHPWISGPYQPNRRFLSRLLWHLLQFINPLPVFQLIYILYKSRPSHIVLNNLYGIPLPSLLLLRFVSKNKSIFIHDFNWVCLSSNALSPLTGKQCTKQCWLCKVLLWPKKVLFHSSKKVFLSTVSFERYQLLLQSPISNSVICHNPCLDFHRLSQLPSKRHQHSPLVFGYIGALLPVKGVHIIIRSFISYYYMTRAQYPCILKIAGSSSSAYIQRLRQLIPDDVPIEFMGVVDPNRFYPNVDVLLTCSLCVDTFPGVVLEALVAGLTVIAPAHTGAVDLHAFFPSKLLLFRGHLHQVHSDKLEVLTAQSLQHAMDLASRMHFSLAPQTPAQNQDIDRYHAPSAWIDRLRVYLNLR
jgi:glycosyltransferase involved in cell wall biosynthesis